VFGSPLAIWWATWKVRNRTIFEAKDMPFQDFKLYFLTILYNWSHVLNGGTNIILVDFGDMMQGA